jgi:hypothetical protein
MDPRKVKPGVPKVDRKSLTESIAEAEATPVAFDPTTRATFIRYNIAIIAKLMKEGVDKTEIFKQCSDFAEQFPELFKKITNGDDMSNLGIMLALLDKMGSDGLSQHKASVAIGQKLAKDYITPVVEKTPPNKKK